MTGVFAACSSVPTLEETPKAPMDVAMDSGGEQMFYRGTAWIPRGFNSPTPFEVKMDITFWGVPAADETGRIAEGELGRRYEGTGTYQPLEDGEGVLSLLQGRLLLRGNVTDEGRELDGAWFFDGKPGGSFRIAQQGVIFPSGSTSATPPAPGSNAPNR